jgi:hypothetical protein
VLTNRICLGGGGLANEVDMLYYRRAEVALLIKPSVYRMSQMLLSIFYSWTSWAPHI